MILIAAPPEMVAPAEDPASLPRSVSSTLMPITVEADMWTRLRAGAHAAALALAEMDDGFNRIWGDERRA